MDKVIDGVDVSGCEFAVKVINDNRIKCHCAKGLLQIAKMQEQPESIKSGLCENNPNCYYKQLQRLKEENDSFMNGEYCANGCKKMNNAFQDVHKCLIQKNEQLKAECERLKKELRNNSDVLIHEMGLKDEYQSDYVFEKLERQKYKQALEDIRELMHENDNIAGCEYCYGDIRYSILTKINEVIGAEE